MNPEDWAALEMLPPSKDHNPYHDYVTKDGQFTRKGLALIKFFVAMTHYADEIMDS